MENNWKPQLRGETYCSSACGGRCTKAAYDIATKNAANLAKRLGPNWKPVVFENLGWHYNVVSPCGRLKINNTGNHYSAYLGEKDSPGGFWVESAATPELAISMVVETAKNEIANLHAIVEGL